MKRIFFITAILICCTYSFGQADEYKKRAIEYLDQGRCVLAEINYKSFIDNGGVRDTILETRIRNCTKPTDEEGINFIPLEVLKKNIYAAISKGDCEEAQRNYNALVQISKSLDRSIETDIRKCRESQPRPHLTFADNRIYANDKELTKNEVQALMANTDALQLYNKGLAKNRNSTVLLISGALVSGGGGYIVAKHPFDKKSFYRGRDGNTYYRYKNETLNDALGIGIIAAGAGMIIVGIVLKSNSPNDIKDAVNMYNGGRNRSSIEWKFDFSGNGVRLALKF